MPKSRVSEMPQRQSPRGPQPLRTSSSNSDPLRHRSITDRSPKLGDRRSPKGSQSDPVNQKKLGTRVADLESQLGQAQEELKILKDQLASVEAAKKEAQEQLEKKTKKPSGPNPLEAQDKNPPTTGVQDSNRVDNNNNPHDTPDDNQRETDVFEVPMEKMTVEPNIEFGNQKNRETNPVSITTESLELQKPAFDELTLKNDEVESWKSKLEEKEKELELFRQENESLKNQLNEAALEMSASRGKEEEMILKLRQLEQQLESSRRGEVQLKEKLEVVEGAKEALETEMKKMRVQTEQWRKAADAAAAVLAGGVETNGRRISERCVSMDKHLGNAFEPSSVGGYAGYVGSPGLNDDLDDGFGGGKRKGSGIRMFGDLWKKKGQK